MELRYWSVPIVNQSTVALWGGNPNQRRQLKTTVYDIGARRLHATSVNLLSPISILKMAPIVLFLFVGMYVFTLFVPGAVMAVTKDKSLSWVFIAWAVPAFIASVLEGRSTFLKKQMLRNALKERGLPASSKIHIVPEKRWDRWASKLQKGP